jgi:hypothetical protein
MLTAGVVAGSGTKFRCHSHAAQALHEGLQVRQPSSTPAAAICRYLNANRYERRVVGDAAPTTAPAPLPPFVSPLETTMS